MAPTGDGIRNFFFSKFQLYSARAVAIINPAKVQQVVSKAKTFDDTPSFQNEDIDLNDQPRSG